MRHYWKRFLFIAVFLCKNHMRIFEHINMSLLVTCLCAILDIGKHIKERQKHETMGGTILQVKSVA